MLNLPGRHVHDGRGNEEGRNLARAALQQVGVLALDNLESADPGADKHAHPLGNLRCDLEARLRHCLLRCRKGKVDEAPHLARFFLVHEIQRVKILDLGGKSDGKSSGVEALNRSHTAGAGYQSAATPRERCSLHRTPAQGR